MSEQQTTSSSRGPWLSVAVLSLLFFGAFFGLRALPVAQCGFLAFEEVVNEDGVIELCATNHAGFLDLTRLQYPVVATFEPAGPLEAGEKVRVTLDLKTSGGMAIPAHQLAITHTEKMHLMLIDPSLEDYHHIHPQEDGVPGRFVFEFEPKLGGTYTAFTEIVPNRSRRQAIAVSSVEVPGGASTPRFDGSLESVVDGLHFKLNGVPDNLRPRRDYRFELTVTDAAGQPADLEMVMGAKGHLVAFDEAKRGFAHMHPIESALPYRTAGLSFGGESSDALAFMFSVPNPGWYRIFAQIQVNGEAVFGRFDVKVGN